MPMPFRLGEVHILIGKWVSGSRENSCEERQSGWKWIDVEGDGPVRTVVVSLYRMYINLYSSYGRMGNRETLPPSLSTWFVDRYNGTRQKTEKLSSFPPARWQHCTLAVRQSKWKKRKVAFSQKRRPTCRQGYYMVYYTGIRKSSVAYTVSLWEKKLINIEVRRLEGETQKKNLDRGKEPSGG